MIRRILSALGLEWDDTPRREALIKALREAGIK